MIALTNISMRHGEQLLFVEASLQLDPGERVGLAIVFTSVVTENVRHFASLRRHGVRVLSTAEFLTRI